MSTGEYNIRYHQQQMQVITTNNNNDTFTTINNAAPMSAISPQPADMFQYVTDGEQPDTIVVEPVKRELFNQNEDYSFLPRAASLDVTSLKNWPGSYGFSLELCRPADVKQKNKICYSDSLNMIYVLPYTAVEARINVVEWNFLGNAEVRVFCAYKESSHRMTTVKRCPTCQLKAENEDPVLHPHMVRLNHSNATYGE